MNQPQYPGNPYGQQPGVHPQTGWPQQAQPQAPQGYPPAQGHAPQAAPQGYPPQAAPQGYPPQAAPQGYPPQAAPQGYPQQGYGQPQQHPGMQPAYGGMQQQPPQMDYSATGIAAEVSPQARAKFIERTYLHLAGAISVFVVLSTILQVMPGIDSLVQSMVQSRASWGVVLVLFMGTSWIADRWALSSTSIGKQYAGLAIYTIAEVIIFVPLLYIARLVLGSAEPIIMAGGATLAMFAAMTAYVFITKKDFSFLRGTLAVLTMGAFALVVGSLIFGFSLGIAFSVGMIVLASGYILFYTSNVLKHYRTDQHVAAALALFSAVALLFWYVLRLVMALARE